MTVTGIIENRGDDEALAIVARQVGRLETGFRHTLARARAHGEIRNTARPDRLARGIIATCYGLGLLSRLPDSGPRVADAVSMLLGWLDDVAV